MLGFPFAYSKEKRLWAVGQTRLVVKAKQTMAYPFNPSFRRPSSSRSTRRINARSRASGRGMIPCMAPPWDHPRKVVYESILELKVLYLLLARPDIWDIREQPQRLRYYNAEGRSKWAVYDFLISLQCGRRIAIAVKPAAIVEEFGFRHELELIRAATPLSFADDVVLVTDRSFAPSEARNAERLHEFRRSPDEEADQVIADLLRGLRTETTIAKLVEPTGLDGRGFRAAFRLLYSGVAQALDTDDISPQTRIVAGGVQ